MEEIKIYSEEVREVLSRPPKSIIRWGNTIMLGFIIVILLLSWFIKYPDIIVAESVITTDIPPQKIYAKVSGKIDTVFVENNSLVVKNSPIAIIENTANYENVFYLKSIIDTIVVNTKSFHFPMESLPMLFLGEIEPAFAEFENKYSQYTLNNELKPFSGDLLANKMSLNELKIRLHSLTSQRELNQQELLFKNKEFKRNQSLFEKGIISEQEFENKKLEYLQAERSFKSLNITISQIRESINNIKNTTRTTEINQTREEINQLKLVIQSFNQLKDAIRVWESKYVLKSNIIGKVSFLNFWHENQSVNNNDLVLTIIPTNYNSYIAKLKAPAQNSGKLKVGQPVNIKLESYPDTEFGVLKGQVSNISLTPDKDGLYIVDVSLPSDLITTYGVKIDFKQEMQGSSEIITEDLRLIERFFYQFKKLISR